MLTREAVKAMFTLAGIPVLNVKPLPDGYGYTPDDPRYFETVPRQAWWFVKTPVGWVEIGWRKRVISIDWSDTPIRQLLGSADVTRSETMIHAWNRSPFAVSNHPTCQAPVTDTRMP